LTREFQKFVLYLGLGDRSVYDHDRSRYGLTHMQKVWMYFPTNIPDSVNSKSQSLKSLIKT